MPGNLSRENAAFITKPPECSHFAYLVFSTGVTWGSDRSRDSFCNRYDTGRFLENKMCSYVSCRWTYESWLSLAFSTLFLPRMFSWIRQTLSSINVDKTEYLDGRLCDRNELSNQAVCSLAFLVPISSRDVTALVGTRNFWTLGSTFNITFANQKVYLFIYLFKGNCSPSQHVNLSEIAVL